MIEMHFFAFFIVTMSIKRYCAIVKNMSISPILNDIDHFPVFRATGDNLKAVLRLCIFLTSFTGNALLTVGKRGNSFSLFFQHSVNRIAA